MSPPYPLTISEIRALRDLEPQEIAYEKVEGFLSQSLPRMQKALPPGECRTQLKGLYYRFVDKFTKENPGTAMWPPYGPIYYGMHTAILKKLKPVCLPSDPKVNKNTLRSTSLETKRRFAVSPLARTEILNESFPEDGKRFRLDPSIKLFFIHALKSMDDEFLDSLRGIEVFYKLPIEILKDRKYKRVVNDQILTVCYPPFKSTGTIGGSYDCFLL